ncbi:hypothetical protein GCM10023169_01300 [Georgenia halophila]|uniref:Fibronectin type-III domain-containing protein n=1 Tax=Georgenia halophila TaxID=620889 RepID=A0ABP8KT55_9MICO
MTGRRTHRGWALLGAAVLAAVVVSPSGETQARWHDHEDVTLGTMTTDTVGMSVTSTGPTTSAVTNTSGSATLAWAPTEVTATPDARTTGAEAAQILGGLVLGYDDCNGGSSWSTGTTSGTTRTITGAPTTLAAGQTSSLCQPVSVTDELALIRSAGARSVDLTTTLAGSAVEAPAWSTTATTSTDVTVPFPQPTSVSCRDTKPGLLGIPTRIEPVIEWSWAGTNVAGQPAVALWEVLVQNGSGSWNPVRTVTSGTMQVTLTNYDLPQPAWTSYSVKVRAYPFTANGQVDRGAYVESDLMVRLGHRITTPPVCDGLVPNTNPSAINLGSAS